MTQNYSGKRPAVAIGSFVVLLMVIESLGQLSIRDIITFGLIYMIGYFYLARWARQKLN